MKPVVNILIAVLVIIIVLSFILVYLNTHPPRSTLNIPPSQFQTAYERVSFTTEDGILIAGWLIVPRQRIAKLPGIIMCHGQGANKSDFTELAVYMSHHGYVVLLFDFRAHGESGGSRCSLGYHEQKDVKAAFDYLVSRSEVDETKIGIFGFSLGASTAILTAAETGKFYAVAADSPFTSLKDQARRAITVFYHLPSFPFLQLAVIEYEIMFRTSIDKIDPESAVKKVSPSPILIIAGEGDDLIPAEDGRRIYSAATEPKYLWIIHVAGHGYTVAAVGDEYKRRIVEFFNAHLNKHSIPPTHL